ncbi:MBL fold metallo-hydrolase [Hyphococcus formosus]|uniref:MBL fold metallo-hydrolase n=1 Tax=Hyphococcus formosus TaxID=3143534 RepID=UPI00398B20BC
MSIRIKFCGAAGTVTGSWYLIRHNQGAFLVDCGMFQGSKTLKELNYGDFPFAASEIDFVLLTHAHIDHSGLLPKLMTDGFRGRVFATGGTKKLLGFMLPDSGYIHEIEVMYLNRRNSQRGIPSVSQIYTREDGEAAAEKITPVKYQTWIEPGHNVRVRFWNAGHILGSASIEIEIQTENNDRRITRLLFSGDIGPDHKLFHPDPEAPSNLDYVVSESTYGARQRIALPPAERRKELSQHIKEAFDRGGVLVMPAFSVERTQELLADISILIHEGILKDRLVFLDSPLAIKATETFAAHAENLEDIGDHGGLFHHPSFHFTRTPEESKAINNYENGVIIIAASGMCEAGRIRHHLKRRLWVKKNTILLSGYQAPGTLGALLESGKKAVRIQGDEIQVNATIKTIDCYSGHVDSEGLVEWILARRPINRAVFLTHGSDEAREALRDQLLKHSFNKKEVMLPVLDEEIVIEGRAKTKPTSPKRLSPDVISAPDWHNDLAQLTLDIRAEIDKASDERSRKIIIRRIRKALENKA